MDLPKVVVFDFDGTLVVSNAVKSRILADCVEDEEGGVERVTGIVKQHPKADRFEIFERFAAGTENEADFTRRLAQKYTKIYLERVSTCPEVPGAFDLLVWLEAQGIPAYVNSATPQESLRDCVTLRGWNGHFQDVLGRPASKQENLNRIAEQHAVSLDQLLMVGDGQADWGPSVELGTRFIGILHEDRQLESQPGCHCLENLKELKKALSSP